MSRAVATTIGLAAVLTGVVVWVLPWPRWHPRATLAPRPPRLRASSSSGTASARPRRTPTASSTWWCSAGSASPTRAGPPCASAPLACVAYLLPAFLDANHDSEAVLSVLSTIPVCLLVGETVAWAMTELASARAVSEHRAQLLRAVARAAGSISALDSDAVLAGVVDTLVGLGFEAANLCVFDDATDTYTVVQPRGLPETYAAGPQSASRGMPALVRQHRSLVTLENYSAHELAVPELVYLGIRTAVAAPVWVQGRLAAALVAGSTRVLPARSEDLEAFELLAGQAGRALENAQRYEEERRATRGADRGVDARRAHRCGQPAPRGRPARVAPGGGRGRAHRPRPLQGRQRHRGPCGRRRRARRPRRPPSILRARRRPHRPVRR